MVTTPQRPSVLVLGEHQVRVMLPLLPTQRGSSVCIEDACGSVVATVTDDARRFDGEPYAAEIAPLFVHAPAMLRLIERALSSGCLDSAMARDARDLCAAVRG